MTDEDRSPDDIEREAQMYLAEVGKILRNERNEQGLGQGQIAERCGRSRGWVGHVERAENSDHVSAKMIALALGLNFALVVAQAEYSVALKLAGSVPGAPPVPKAANADEAES